MSAASRLTSSREIERKYEVVADAELPDLSGPSGASVDADTQRLVATYYDTADLRLSGSRITLRHRTGDDVAGWHLKLPLAGAREELHVSASARTVPKKLQSLVRSVIRDASLVPVASLTTRREVRLLRGPDGRPLAEVVDDRVDGRLLIEPEAPLLRWREWEAEDKGDDADVLDRLEPLLLAAGARPSQAASKLGRVLALTLAPQQDEPWWSGGAAPQAPPSAATVVQAHLREQLDELVRRDPEVRRDLPDALHKMRVATRRLRSALRTFAPLLERERGGRLYGELAHLAGVLGQVRDVEVMHARVLALIAQEPDELVLGPVRRRTDTLLRGRERVGRREVLRELDGDRYLRLLDDLHELVADPGFTERAHGPAETVLPPLVRDTWKRLHHTMRAAAKADAPEQDELLHEARKRAKAARYAAEAVESAFGKPARRFAAAMEQLQEVLGEHQDGVVTREVLRELGAASSGAGENGFTFGRLHALEQARAEAAVARWPTVRREVSRRRLRRWLDEPDP